jgi:hypothetical protein
MRLKLIIKEIQMYSVKYLILWCLISIGFISFSNKIIAKPQILKAATFKYYIDSFNQNDEEIYKQHFTNRESWGFLKENIPFFECPDKELEKTYYFRWWTYRKHIKKTPEGFIVTEFLPDVPWAGKYNSINAPAGHQIYEGRWLLDQTYIEGYINFWFNEGSTIREYSTWIADAIYQFCLVKGDFSLAIKLLPKLKDNFIRWENKNKHTSGLFWSNDDRDGMEVSVSGNGLRPTLNSYMYGDALAISKLAALAGDLGLEIEFREKAKELRHLILRKLWDPKVDFFKVIPLESKDDNISFWSFDDLHKHNVREQIGFIPWYFNIPGSEYNIAWQLLASTDGFYAPYGPTTTERTHPEFQISYEGHECQWNGPSWPYATSQTLTGLANLLNNEPNPYISNKHYFDLLKIYSNSHRRKNNTGEILPWIDENLNPFTGDWISRTRLKSWHNNTWSLSKGGIERGKDYNHSTFCDLIISGLIGIRPQDDQTLIINPLLPENSWDYFCLDNILVHNLIITVLYDKNGDRYKRGTGLKVFVDGKEVASSPIIERLTVKL